MFECENAQEVVITVVGVIVTIALIVLAVVALINIKTVIYIIGNIAYGGLGLAMLIAIIAAYIGKRSI